MDIKTKIDRQTNKQTNAQRHRYAERGYNRERLIDTRKKGIQPRLKGCIILFPICKLPKSKMSPKITHVIFVTGSMYFSKQGAKIRTICVV